MENAKELINKTYRSDREIVMQYQTAKTQAEKNTAAYEMWDKFYRLRQKMKFELIALARRNHYQMQEAINSWDAFAWEKFIHQFDGIRLDDPATKKPTWSNYVRLWGYWRSMNRDLVSDYLDFAKNNVSYEGSLSDNEDDKGLEGLLGTKGDIQEESMLEDSKKKFWAAFEKFKETLSPKQKLLLNMKSQDMSETEIKKKLGINKKIFDAETYLLRERFKSYFGNEYGQLLEDLQNG